MKVLQNTLKKQFSFSGISLHLGRWVNVKVRPAFENHGVQFVRTDIKNKDPRIKAVYNAVSDTNFSTKIRNSDGTSVQTIEHLMAALAGTGIHNALIEIDGPELPILDGSSREFVKLILSSGKRALKAPVNGLLGLDESILLFFKVSINIEIDPFKPFGYS